MKNCFTSLYNYWMKFALLLNKITNPIILGFFFFVIVTPIALLMKLCRKDLLSLKFCKSSTSQSYWIAREPGPSPVSMKYQF